MGLFILLIAIVVETAFAAFCLVTKSNQAKMLSVMRILALTGFVLLALLPAMDWSSRYYAVGALLLVLALIGVVCLSRKPEDRTAYRASRVVRRAAGMAALIFTLSLPAVAFPESRPLSATGKYQVVTWTENYTDTSRVETYTDTGENRQLMVEFWYPDNADGTYPLVVFSHGGFSVRSSNESLYNELASHGYVVCSIDHTYHCLSTTDQDGDTIWIDTGYMQECSAENARLDPQNSYECYQKWMSIRTGDINFVTDYILAEAKYIDAEPIYKLVDEAKIGVIGHSLGGSAALGIGRMRDDVGAVIALESPFLCDILAVQDGEFVFEDDVYPVPVLNVYSDTGWGLLADRPQYAQNYALLSASQSTAFNLHIGGVGHFGLTDLALTSPLLTRIFDGQKPDAEFCLRTINQVSLEFFDCYLKGLGKFTTPSQVQLPK